MLGFEKSGKILWGLMGARSLASRKKPLGVVFRKNGLRFGGVASGVTKRHSRRVRDKMSGAFRFADQRDTNSRESARGASFAGGAVRAGDPIHIRARPAHDLPKPAAVAARQR